jgi:predicted regulator of Ras-like GTPase activity (Roadblock/LC7/MglB family)
LSDSSALLAYDDSNSYQKAVVLTIASANITANSITQISHRTGVDLPFELALIDTDKALLAFKDVYLDVYAQILSVSGTSITADSTLLVASSVSGNSMSVQKISTTKAAIACNYTDIVFISITGTLLASSSSPITISGTNNRIALARIDDDEFLYAFEEATTNNGKSVLTRFSADYTGIIGIATERATAGSTCGAGFGKIIAGLSGLTAGEKYYLQSDGSISTTESDCYIGKAISTTELRYSPNY